MTLAEVKAYIKAHYGKQTPKQIAEETGKTPDYIRQIARRLGYRLQAPRKGNRARCKGCLLQTREGVCIYHNEGDVYRCRAMKITENVKWPKKETIWTI